MNDKLYMISIPPSETARHLRRWRGKGYTRKGKFYAEA